MIEAQRDASRMTRLGWRFEALAWDLYNAWYRAKSIDEASDAGAALIKRLGPLTPTHEIARINMQRCFPDADPVEIDRLLDGMWESFGRFAGEMPHMGVFATPEFHDRVEFIGRERLEAARDANKALVLVGMHHSNWEIAAAAIMQTGLNCHITYRPANNPLIDDRITGTRQDYGIKLLTAKGGDGAKSLMSALKRGESVALMNDQKMNDGISVPFFGHPAMTAPGPTRLALRYDLDIVPISVHRLEGASFRVIVHDPIEKSEHPDRSTAISQTVTRISAWVEQEVRKTPEQWFWVHRRWAKDVYKKPRA